MLVTIQGEEIQKDIQWILNNLTVYLAPGKKRELILRWADDLVDLHKLGEYTEPLTTICSHIRAHLRSIHQEHALPYVNEVLPFKFKEMKYTPSEFLDEDIGSEILTYDSSDQDAKILLAEDCKKLNHQYISRLDRTISYLQQFKKCLETDTPLEDKIPEKELQEYLVRWDGALILMKEVLDGRDKVLPSTLHMMFYAKAQATLNDAYSKYVTYIRDFASITAKQAGKLLKGHVTKVELLYEPKNRQEARHAGFYGIQCQECGTWRVSYKYNPNSASFMLYCYANGHWSRVKTERMGIR